MKKLGKILLIILCSLLSLIIITLACASIVWFNEISTISSIKLLSTGTKEKEGNVYSLNIKGDYYLDDLVAQGGVSSDNQLIEFVLNKATRGLVKIDISAVKPACTCFKSKLQSGDILFSRNYDMKKTNSMIVSTNPGNGRYSSISCIDLQYVAVSSETGIVSLKDKIKTLAAAYVPVDGMNSAGLAFSLHISHQGNEQGDSSTQQNTDKPDITSTSFARLLLDYCGSVDEAIELARSYDMHDSNKHTFQYMVCDASGKSAIICWVNDNAENDEDGTTRRLEIIEDTTNYQVMTNFIVLPSYYTDETKMVGLQRYQTVSTSLSTNNGILSSENDAFTILSSVGRRQENLGPVTVHSVVYNLSKKTMTFVDNENYGDSSHTFNFSI